MSFCIIVGLWKWILVLVGWMLMLIWLVGMLRNSVMMVCWLCGSILV